MKRIAATCLISVSCLYAQACATIVHGSRQTIRVTTTPPGARASYDDQVIVTPGSIRVTRKGRNTFVRIELDGYQAVRIDLKRALSGSLWWNGLLVPLGAIAGAEASDDWVPVVEASVGAAALTAVAVGIDFASGAAYQQKPATLDIVLTPSPKP